MLFFKIQFFYQNIFIYRLFFLFLLVSLIRVSVDVSQQFVRLFLIKVSPTFTFNDTSTFDVRPSIINFPNTPHTESVQSATRVITPSGFQNRINFVFELKDFDLFSRKTIDPLDAKRIKCVPQNFFSKWVFFRTAPLPSKTRKTFRYLFV